MNQEILKLLQEAGGRRSFRPSSGDRQRRSVYLFSNQQLMRFFEMAQAAEREAIISMCEEFKYSHQYVHSFKHYIKARGDK